MTVELRKKLQAEYENLDFPPGANAIEILKDLAKKHNISYDDLIDNINL